MGSASSLGTRLRKPILVAFVAICVFACGFVLYFQSVGVLGSSREYPALLDEAKKVGIPVSRQELSERERKTHRGGNILVPLKEALTTIERAIAQNYVHPVKAQAGNPSFKWPIRAAELYEICAPQIEKLKSLETDSYIQKPSSERFGPSIIHDRDNHNMRGFATLLASSGRFKEAGEIFEVVAKLNRWQSTEQGSLRAMSLRNQLNLVDEVTAFIRANPKSPELKRAAKAICDTALDPPYDYRKDYWRNLNEIVLPLSTKSIGWSNPSSPYGRSLLWMNIPLVLQATKADMLRAHLAGYKILDADPNSVVAANRANAAVMAELGKSNRLTRELIVDCAPVNFAPRIDSIIKSLQATQKRYQ